MAILLRQKACYLFGLVLVFSFFTSSAGSAAEDLNRQIENLAKDLTVPQQNLWVTFGSGRSPSE